MSLDQRAQVLEIVLSTKLGVRDLALALGWKTSRVISLIRKMNEEKLIDLQKEATSSKRGRPKKNIICTPLGAEFLEAYRKLKMKPLKARKEDLERAVRDASYASRLVANGHSPFKIFMELNAIARNIKNSSETFEII
jgi:transcription initiation factor IIE alpha subunit